MIGSRALLGLFGCSLGFEGVEAVDDIQGRGEDGVQMEESFILSLWRSKND
jgi:hypothetical protein